MLLLEQPAHPLEVQLKEDDKTRSRRKKRLVRQFNGETPSRCKNDSLAGWGFIMPKAAVKATKKARKCVSARCIKKQQGNYLGQTKLEDYGWDHYQKEAEKLGWCERGGWQFLFVTPTRPRGTNAEFIRPRNITNVYLVSTLMTFLGIY